MQINLRIKKKKNEILDYIQELIAENEFLNRSDERKYYEGGKIRATVEQRKRDARAREECIKIFGYSCKICGINFEKFYGDIGKNFIEVHHKNELSLLSEETTETDPRKDLIPVCSNCHSMIHRKTPCYEPKEIKKILNERRKRDGKRT